MEGVSFTPPRQLLPQPHVLIFLLPLEGHINPFLHLGEQLSTFNILSTLLVLGPSQLASNGTLQTQSHPTHQFKWNKGNTYYVPILSNKRNTFLKSWWWCECCHFVVTLGIIQWHCLLLWVSLSLSLSLSHCIVKFLILISTKLSFPCLICSSWFCLCHHLVDLLTIVLFLFPHWQPWLQHLVLERRFFNQLVVICLQQHWIWQHTLWRPQVDLTLGTDSRSLSDRDLLIGNYGWR